MVKNRIAEAVKSPDLPQRLAPYLVTPLAAMSINSGADRLPIGLPVLRANRVRGQPGGSIAICAGLI